MIHNQQQLERNKYWIEVFGRQIKELTEASLEARNVHPTLYKTYIDGLQSVVKDLQEEVDEYLKPISATTDEELAKYPINRRQKDILPPEPEVVPMGKQWEVWLEGYAATGESSTAQKLTSLLHDRWQGETFQDAVRLALGVLTWDMKYYDEKKNAFWGCRFFDNETDARKSFG